MDEVAKTIEDVLEQRNWSGQAALSLVGRVQSLETVHFGRCGAAQLWTLRKFGASKGHMHRIPDNVEEALRWIKDYLPRARPRTIDALAKEPPIVVFTDGACETDGVTVGAVMFDGWEKARYIEHKMDEQVAESWRRGASKQVIGQAEIFPVLMATTSWRPLLENRYVIWFIDQDAARQALVKKYSPSEPSAKIIGDIAMQHATMGCYSWFARVPTDSNIADEASRFKFNEAVKWIPHTVRDRPCIPEGYGF